MSDEEEEAPKPEPKNPLDLLPPSKMILDYWKRLHSNTKTNFHEAAINLCFSHLPLIMTYRHCLYSLHLICPLALVPMC